MKTTRAVRPPHAETGTSGMQEGLERRVGHELPQLSAEETSDLAQVVGRLVEALKPERIYVFGSQARGTATGNSDVDLLVIVPDTDEPGYRRDQAAFAAVGDHLLPLDILVFTRAEFEAKAASPASLPATVYREGRTLYAA